MRRRGNALWRLPQARDRDSRLRRRRDRRRTRTRSIYPSPVMGSAVDFPVERCAAPSNSRGTTANFTARGTWAARRISNAIDFRLPGRAWGGAIRVRLHHRERRIRTFERPIDVSCVAGREVFGPDDVHGCLELVEAIRPLFCPAVYTYCMSIAPATVCRVICSKPLYARVSLAP